MAKVIPIHDPNKVDTEPFIHLVQSLSNLNKVLLKIEESIKNTPKYAH